MDSHTQGPDSSVLSVDGGDAQNDSMERETERESETERRERSDIVKENRISIEKDPA